MRAIENYKIDGYGFSLILAGYPCSAPRLAICFTIHGESLDCQKPLKAYIHKTCRDI
ncbi:MAG: hypothetical protein N2647_00755 [Thermodesulfovibrio sp.]|nr:hypothetical protein [Thermodesulfovibrio sp.]